MPKALLILTREQVNRMIRRMAYEIYEKHYKEKELLLLGVEPRGIVIAEKIFSVLKEISPLKIACYSVHTRKKYNETVQVFLDKNIGFKNKTVILVDDVMYSGNTLFYGLSSVKQKGPRVIRIAVLIDRGHRTLPLSPDFVGHRLSTTLQEHVRVKITSAEGKQSQGRKTEVYLE